MDIVSRNTDADVRRKDAERRLEWATKELAANILRVLAGAGKSYKLIGDAEEFLEAVTECQGVSDPDLIEKSLHDWNWNPKKHDGIQQSDIDRWVQDGTYSEEVAQDGITDSCMRVVAARLLGQRSQESNADHQFFESQKQWAWARETRIKKFRDGN